MEEEDLLESGIRIIAQPPGKKLAEYDAAFRRRKILNSNCTVICNQNLKPSPFCLLDEIEAALDDNNVARFAKYLHKLTKNTRSLSLLHIDGERWQQQTDSMVLPCRKRESPRWYPSI